MATATQQAPRVPESLQRIIEARHHDPFEVLGRHLDGDAAVVRVFLPDAETASLVEAAEPFARIEGTDFFVWEGSASKVPARYRIDWVDSAGRHHVHHDPYCFPPQLPDFDLHLFGEGRHWHAYRFMGSHLAEVEGVAGVQFAVWAPSAERVSVVGDFNSWDGRAHPMRVRGGTGVWELFIPGIGQGGFYKYEIRDRATNIHVKIDPYAQAFQERPQTAGLICPESRFRWADQAWMQARTESNWQRRPFSVYEVHLGSWQRTPDGEFLNYRVLAKQLADYVAELGFTHIELLPITEHPLDASWGYQCTGYFAPSARFGSPDDFRFFVDYLHRRGIGVLLDWVPAHFPKDAYALARFDGTALYEHADPRMGEHKDWGTLIFNFGRNEVKNFLLSSALYWLDEFHLDGLRVDAVASMLYLDYSRNAGEWIPNKYGGNENLEAVDFIRQLNTVTHEQHPGTLMIAEESTAWPAVSRPDLSGRAGFQHEMEHGVDARHPLLYAEGSDLPAFPPRSADLRSLVRLYREFRPALLSRRGGARKEVHARQDAGRCLAAIREPAFALHPDVQLSRQETAFPGVRVCPWRGVELRRGYGLGSARAPAARGGQKIVSDLNRLYREQPALHEVDFDGAGFEWIDCHDSSQSVLVYLRKDLSGEHTVAAAFNFTPVPRTNYRIGVPEPGFYREALNSDAALYGGSNVGNQGGVEAEPVSWMGRPYSIPIALPPLAGLILVHEPTSADAVESETDAAIADAEVSAATPAKAEAS
jgi:1,4-alpha-glucan branching enzyme